MGATRMSRLLIIETRSHLYWLLFVTHYTSNGNSCHHWRCDVTSRRLEVLLIKCNFDDHQLGWAMIF